MHKPSFQEPATQLLHRNPKRHKDFPSAQVQQANKTELTTIIEYLDDTLIKHLRVLLISGK